MNRSKLRLNTDLRRLYSVVFLLVVIGATAFSQSRPDALELYRNGQYQRAISVTLQEIEEQPRNMNAYTVLGWSLNALDRHEEAVQYAEQALQVSRYDNRIIQILAEAHYYLGNDIEALKYLQEYAAIAPQGSLIAEVYYFMGEIFLRLEEYNHADIALTTATFHAEDRPLWWARLGYAREMAGDEQPAVEAYRRALSLNSSLMEAQRGLERVQG